MRRVGGVQGLVQTGGDVCRAVDPGRIAEAEQPLDRIGNHRPAVEVGARAEGVVHHLDAAD